MERLASNVKKRKAFLGVTGGIEKTAACIDGFIHLVNVVNFLMKHW